MAKIKLSRPAVWFCLMAAGIAALAGPEVGLAQHAAPLYGPVGVSPAAVKQGRLGSCYFHASVAAMASAMPDVLRQAIAAEPGGGYRVHFFDGRDELVYQEDLEYAAAHSFDHSEGAWVRVLMRAYAQRVLRASLHKSIETSSQIPVFVRPMALSALDQGGGVLMAYDRAIRMVVSQDGEIDKKALKVKLGEQGKALGIPASITEMISGFLDEKGFFEGVEQTVRENGEFFGAYRSLSQGGIPAEVLRAFVGTAHERGVQDRARTLAQLRRLGQHDLAMTAESGSPGSFDPGNWWVGGHAYTVLGYDEAAQSVSLRNPWGGHPEPDGIFNLPVTVFLEAFDSYTASGEED
ncbi:MAG TPA: hypothetical protein VG225_02920 [Terracidiphilus sp.]|nr:hypothetical protein [Terracidiphilus sp.]